MSELQLTDRALFPKNEREAIANVIASLSIVMDFMTPIVKSVNDSKDARDLWDIGVSLLASADVFFAEPVK